MGLGEGCNQGEHRFGHIYVKSGSLGTGPGVEDSRPGVGTAARLCRTTLPASLGPCLSLVSHRPAGAGPRSVDVTGLCGNFPWGVRSRDQASSPEAPLEAPSIRKGGSASASLPYSPFRGQREEGPQGETPAQPETLAGEHPEGSWGRSPAGAGPA